MRQSFIVLLALVFLVSCSSPDAIEASSSVSSEQTTEEHVHTDTCEHAFVPPEEWEEFSAGTSSKAIATQESAVYDCKFFTLDASKVEGFTGLNIGVTPSFITVDIQVEGAEFVFTAASFTVQIKDGVISQKFIISTDEAAEEYTVVEEYPGLLITIKE